MNTRDYLLGAILTTMLLFGGLWILTSDVIEKMGDFEKVWFIVGATGIIIITFCAANTKDDKE